MSGGVLATQFETIDVWLIAAIVVLLLIAIATAVAETAIVRISKAKAAGLAEEGRPGANALLYLVQAPERWINALLLVVLVCQIVQATLTGVVSGRLFGGLGVAVATFVNVVITFVFAEAAPKTWALQHTERAALASARPVKLLVDLAPLRLVSRALIGVTNVILPGKGLKQGPFVSEEELLAVAAEAHESEAIDNDERRLIESIIEFGDTVVREVMVPRPDMVTVSHEFRVADVMEVVLLNGYSRLPVLGEGIDDVIGLVFAKDLMRAERDGREDEPVANLVRSARAVPETKPVAELLREMQANQFHMAVVIDEYGGTAGLVTLEDLIEELVGEIVDEFDIEDARIEPVAGGGVRVSGSLTIDDANDLLDVQLPEGDFDTVSGLVLAELGRIAVVGDVAECEGVRLTVERVQGRRIMRVRIDKVEPLVVPDEDDADDRRSRDKERDRARADRNGD
ncbi:hemolysin family protein [Aquihabitans sp. G128]|uniref:hemolysin family protein n=1 Tax=Aquihabitans sp. G128 TaxID=2849779 RepID=UPI001C215B3E|nr:hemolysin family protein [Aquihabitans sp. G128]QXC62391.1 hemolysin family protein [Aquihabitans sp. G128]